MLKHTKEGAKFALVDKAVIDRLVGVIHSESSFPALGGLIHDEDALLVDAQSKKVSILFYYEGIIASCASGSIQILPFSDSAMDRISY